MQSYVPEPREDFTPSTNQYYRWDKGDVGHDTSLEGGPEMRARAMSAAGRALEVNDRSAMAGEKAAASDRTAGGVMSLLGDLLQVMEHGASPEHVARYVNPS